MPEVLPPGQPVEPAYDVFVSYRQVEPDLGWVRRRLVPALRAGGLRVCLDVDDFRLGAPLVLEMSRAVETSACTVVVLTPAWQASAFTELESVLAEHLGLETERTRLVGLLREATRPRLGLRARLWLDMTDDAGFDDDVARLCRELRRAPGA